MSAIHTKSLTGITSITTPPGVDNVFTVHSNDTTERFRVDQSGNQNISGIVTASNFKTGVSNLHNLGLTLSSGQLDIGSNIKAGNAGVITATAFHGSGANLTGITQTTINNNAANKVIMGSNTANTLEAVAKSSLFSQINHGQSFLDDNYLIFGDASDLQLVHQSSGAKARIRNTNDSGSLDIESTLTRFLNKDGSTEKIRITSDGKLLVGVTSSDFKLHVDASNKAAEIGIDNSSTYKSALNTTNNVNADFNIQHKINSTSIGTGVNVPLCFHINGGFAADSAEKMRLDTNGNFIIGATGTGNASVYARNILISGSSNNGITIHTTDTSGSNRKCCLFFGTGTSVADMADGMLFYDHAGQYMHLSVNGAGTGVTKASMRLHSDGTVRFDSTPTTTNSISLLLKSHKARAVNDNNGILFKDASDHSQAAIYVQKKSTSNGSSDLVFSTSSGQVVASLQGIPERMRINQDGIITNPYQASFYATANSGGTVSMTSTHTLTNWRLSTSGKTFDIGSNFNTSNGRFTAPVTGKYLFTASILLAGYDQANSIHMMWRKNGTTMQYWYNTRTSDIDRSGYGGYLAQGSTTTFSLSANDYIEIACNFGGSLSLWCGDANWGHFSGHLLG